MAPKDNGPVLWGPLEMGTPEGAFFSNAAWEWGDDRQPGGVQERAQGGQRLGPGEPHPETAPSGRRPLDSLRDLLSFCLSVCLFLNK